MNYKRISIVCFVCLAGYACEFERIIPLDKLHTPQLGITAQLTDQDSIYRIFVSETLPVNDTASYKVVEDADVLLMDENGLSHSFQFNPNTRYYELDANTFALSETGRLSLVTSHPVLGTAMAEQSFPLTIPRVTLTDSITFSEEDGFITRGSFEITLDIAPGKNRYYVLQGLLVGKTSFDPDEIDPYPSPLFLQTESPFVEYNSTYRIFFKDEQLNSTQLRLSLDFTTAVDSLEQVTFTIASCTEAAYLYELSLDRYSDAEGSPFAEPVTLISNIENGTGLFGLYSIQQFELLK